MSEHSSSPYTLFLIFIMNYIHYSIIDDLISDIQTNNQVTKVPNNNAVNRDNGRIKEHLELIKTH